MLRSLYAGVSGMKSNQTKMDVIGNNISNVNTTGFKAGRVSFQDLFSQTVSSAQSPTNTTGGVNAVQVGLGVSIATIGNIMTGGSIQSTGRDLDIAIEGQGFLVVSPDGGTTKLYTRDGTLYKDEAGNLVTATGMKVQGYTIGQKTSNMVTSIPYYLSPSITPDMLAATSPLASLGSVSALPTTPTLASLNTTIPLSLPTAPAPGTLDYQDPATMGGTDIGGLYLAVDWDGDASTGGVAGGAANEEARLYTVAGGFDIDTDNDGVADIQYRTVNKDGNPATVEYAVDTNADGTADFYTLQDGANLYYGFDTDNDTFVDFYTADLKDATGSPGADGVFDTFRIDSNDDGTIDYRITNVDFDGNVATAEYGVDSNADGTIDYYTLQDGANKYYGFDTDNDGTVNFYAADLKDATGSAGTDGVFDTFRVNSDDTGAIDYHITGVDFDSNATTVEYAVDNDADGTVDYYTLQDGTRKYYGFDTDADGKIDYYAADLKDALGAAGTDGVFDTYAVDANGDGKIDYHMVDSGSGKYAVDTNRDGTKEYDFIAVNDSDGVFEYYGVDTNNDGKVNSKQVDEDGDGIIDYYSVDQDDDGKIDYRYYAIDEDNDGTIDYYNKDINQDGIVDYFPADVNNDKTYDYYASQDVADISDTVMGNLVVPQFIGGYKVEEVSVDGNGYVKGVYNGEIYYLGKLTLAKFSNPEGLEKMGNNTYAKSSNSGEPTYGTSGVDGMGKIRTGSLEMSNVDLATEFTEMIITSRAYSANSKIITTSDEMLQELIGLKR